MTVLDNGLDHAIARRSFVRRGLAATSAAAAAALLPIEALAAPTQDDDHDRDDHGRITAGDAAILRLLSAAEILESDFWRQYNELGGIQDSELPGGGGNPTYAAAINNLDEDMDQYIRDNTEDEVSHFTFLNAYLVSKGAKPVNLDQFRTLPSSTASGAQQIGRLTNLTQLSVDTSWWIRYRSGTPNPDLGDTIPQFLPQLAAGKFPATPRSNADLAPHDRIQAIANTAGFHFAFIEQGGTSLYAALAQRVTSLEVLRVVISIGGTEIQHFQAWQDKAGNAPPANDPVTGLVFPDFSTPPFQGERQAQLDHAGADRVPQSEVPDRLDHPPHGHEKRRG
jgi:hypothetical protein